MKLFIVSMLALISVSSDCNKKNTVRYKARLEIKGICMNYTISLLEGDIDSSKIEKSWTDENSGKSYSNAFALGNPCDFPSDINAGDTFYFNLDTTEQKPCVVCQAYYPTPAKKLNIKVEPK
jgi:hypothetical protein